jgi:hypothetical protein
VAVPLSGHFSRFLISQNLYKVNNSLVLEDEVIYFYFGRNFFSGGS